MTRNLARGGSKTEKTVAPLPFLLANPSKHFCNILWNSSGIEILKFKLSMFSIVRSCLSKIGVHGIQSIYITTVDDMAKCFFLGGGVALVFKNEISIFAS
jgi:hypothetical protein